MRLVFVEPMFKAQHKVETILLHAMNE